ncbi:MAG: HAD family hydrolase [Polyangia bacterium]
MSGSTLRGVVFDLDGTLYELGARKARMALLLWRELGLLRRLQPVRRSLRGRVFASREELLGEMYSRLASRAGVEPERAARWYRERFLAEFVRLLRRRAKTRPGLEGLLKSLRRQGIRLAVLSDYGMVEERLEALGIDPSLFDEIAAMEDWGVLKPAGSPLRDISGKWGVEPSGVIVVGDRLELDGRSAEEAGMDFVGVAGRPQAEETRWSRWKDVAALLERRAAQSEATFTGRSTGDDGSAPMRDVVE